MSLCISIPWLAAAGVEKALPAESIALVDLMTQWKYNTNGANPPAIWTTNNFNDSSWATGRGLFGFEEFTTYPVPFSTFIAPPSLGGPLTVYFRTSFFFPSNTAGVTLLASNLIDEGIVVFLNGAEIYRYRVPTGQVYSTLANAVPSSEGIFEITSVVAPLRQGSNVLAAELHQVANNSSDCAFALSLTALIPQPIVITNQPASQTVVAGQSATFTVGVSGSNPHYRWFRNNVLVLSGFNLPSYTTPSTTTEMSGTVYSVIVSNALGRVTSSNAVLTVVPDEFGPRLLEANATNGNQIHIVFDETVMRPTATNRNNYTVTLFGSTNPLPLVTNIIAYAASVVRLTMAANLNPTNDYVLTVNNVTDTKTNVIDPDSWIFVKFHFTNELSRMDAIWAWDESGADLGFAWRQLDYDDYFWASGPGVHYYEFNNLLWCGARNTVITYGYRTYYFRKRFSLDPNTGKGTLLLNHLIDDGAVFYLNGQEIYRYNMPTTAVSAATFAITNLEAQCVSRTIGVSNFVKGENVLAVEVHQAGPADEGDVVFGADLSAILEKPSPEPVNLQLMRASPMTASLSWTNAGGMLQFATSLAGPWIDVATNSPHSTDLTGTNGFFRLRPR